VLKLYVVHNLSHHVEAKRYTLLEKDEELSVHMLLLEFAILRLHFRHGQIILPSTLLLANEKSRNLFNPSMHCCVFRGKSIQDLSKSIKNSLFMRTKIYLIKKKNVTNDIRSEKNIDFPTHNQKENKENKGHSEINVYAL